MHLATLMHSRLYHLLYNHVIVLLEFQGGEICQVGEILSRGAEAPLCPPLNEALVHYGTPRFF